MHDKIHNKTQNITSLERNVILIFTRRLSSSSTDIFCLSLFLLCFLRIIILLVTWVTPPLFGSPRSELRDLPRGPAIQRRRRVLVKMNGGEETTMDLHHSPSPPPWSPTLLLFANRPCALLDTRSLSPSLRLLPVRPAASTSGHLSGGGRQFIARCRKNTSCSLFTARPHCSGYENGLCFALVLRGFTHLQASRQITDDMYLFDTVPRNRQSLSNVIWFSFISSYGKKIFTCSAVEYIDQCSASRQSKYLCHTDLCFLSINLFLSENHKAVK